MGIKAEHDKKEVVVTMNKMKTTSVITDDTSIGDARCLSF